MTGVLGNLDQARSSARLTLPTMTSTISGHENWSSPMLSRRYFPSRSLSGNERLLDDNNQKRRRRLQQLTTSTTEEAAGTPQATSPSFHTYAVKSPTKLTKENETLRFRLRQKITALRNARRRERRLQGMFLDLRKFHIFKTWNISQTGRIMRQTLTKTILFRHQ